MLAVAAFLAWSHDTSKRGASATLNVVHGAFPDRPPAASTLGSTRPSDAIAASEIDAARPAPGGPGPKDVRPHTVPAATRGVPAVRDGLVIGTTLNGTSSAFFGEGFRDGDVLTAVGGRPVAPMATRDAVAQLTPGMLVEVLRDGEPVAWRIDGKRE